MVREAGRGQQGLARDAAGTGRVVRQQERSRGSSRGPGQRDTISGFKGTELMQVPCFGLGGRSDSHQRRVIPQVTPRSLEAETSNPGLPFCEGILGTVWTQERSDFTCIGPSPKSALSQPWSHNPNPVYSQGGAFMGWVFLGRTGADGCRLENQFARASCARKAAQNGK